MNATRWCGLVSAAALGPACAAIVGIQDLGADGGTDASLPDGPRASDAPVAPEGPADAPREGAPLDAGAAACDPDHVVCDGKEVDPFRDSNNCAHCGHVCGNHTQCFAGYCVSPTYASPDGAGTGQTATDPEKFSPTLFKQLGSGQALVLLDGTYTPESTGLMDANCSMNDAQNGLSDSPVVVTALDEREAIFASDGSQSAIDLEGCEYWVIDGLTATSKSLAYDGGAANLPHTVNVQGGSNVTLRRLLVDGTNQDYPTAGVLLASSNARLVDSEIYDFLGNGVVVAGGPAELQRDYLNPRLAGPTDASVNGVGAWSRALIENVTVEGANIGFYMEPFGAGQNIAILGSIVLGGASGVFDHSTVSYSVRDLVVIDQDAGSAGIGTGYGAPATISNVTLENTGGALLGASEGGTVLDLGAYGTNGGAGEGIDIRAPSWTVSYTNSYGYDNAYTVAPDAGVRVHTLDEEPFLGPCLAYVLPTSPMFDAGENGGPIGAMIVDRYEDGGLTDAGLWTCGGFPCGKVVAPYNDQTTGTCMTVGARLNFVDGGCPIPGAP